MYIRYSCKYYALNFCIVCWRECGRLSYNPTVWNLTKVYAKERESKSCTQCVATNEAFH